MSTPEPAPTRRRSTRNAVAKWIVIACAVVVLAVVTFLRVTSHHAEMLVQDLRDRDQPVCAADIEFDSNLPTSDLEERARNMRSARIGAAWIDPDGPDPDHQLAALKAWPAGKAAVPAVRDYLACIKSEPATRPVPTPETKIDRSAPTKPRLFMSRIRPHSWDELARACMDPQKIDHLTDCQRTGIEAMCLLNEPMAPTAFDACKLSRETGEQVIRAWTPSQVEPGSSVFPVIDGARVLWSTIPRSILQGDSRTALERVEAILHLAESLRGLPWVSGHRMWLRTVSMGLDGCRMLLASHASAIDWTNVLHQLDSFDPPANLERALVGGRALGIETFQAARSGHVDANSALAGMCSDVYALDLDGGADFSLYLEVMGESIDLARIPIWKSPRGPRDWQRDEGEFPLWAELSWHLLPTLDDLRSRTYAVEMDVEMARIAIMASQQGADAAVKTAESTTDLFDGHPLRTRRDAHVLAIWSVGMNQVDDGGSSEQELSDEMKIRKRVFTSHWSKGDGTPCDADIVWRVRLQE